MQTMSSMPVSRVVGQPPVSGTSPAVGRRPAVPVEWLGTRIEPPPSVPRPAIEARAPIRAPSPPLEPPLVRAGSNAFSVRPWSALSVS